MDITHRKIIYLKAGLFVVAGAMASALIVMESPLLRTAALLAIAIWCFARAYYFAFYVIEHYVDATFKYAGMLALVRHMIARKPQENDKGRG